MNRSLIASLLLTAGSLATLALAPADRIVFTQAGFSIDVLDSAPGTEPFQPVLMTMPASDGFAPNVNVQVQPYPDGLDAYRKLTLAQFEQFGLEVVQERELAANTLLFEYAGKMQGMDLHFYARAVQREGRIHLATGTALKTQWEKAGPALRACVDSLELPRIDLKTEKPDGKGGLFPGKQAK
jgi:hypothetical protein